MVKVATGGSGKSTERVRYLRELFIP